MKFFKEILKSKKAITLISLVVTIVILVILAAVAINMAIGNNGLFTKTKLAKGEYVNASEKEKSDIDVLVNDVDVAAGSRAPSSQSVAMSDINQYSNTQEQAIGTWVNGKTIYRKTIIKNISLNIPVKTWKEILSEDVTNLDIEDLISIGGTAKMSNGAYYVINGGGHTTDVGVTAYLAATKSIKSYAYTTASGITGFTLNLNIEYTKTTSN